MFNYIKYVKHDNRPNVHKYTIYTKVQYIKKAQRIKIYST